jgi:hypothetical protein
MSDFGLNNAGEDGTGGGDEGTGGGGGYDDQQQPMDDGGEPTLEIDLDEIENQNPDKQSPPQKQQSAEKELRNQILCK